MMNSQGRRSVLLALVGSLLLVLGAAPATAARIASAAAPDCGMPPALPRALFPAHPKIDNQFFPLVPGTQWTLKGTVDGARHTVVSTVTDLTKKIDGVTGVVVRDTDFDETGRIAEDEIAVFAQERRGDVWLLAEYPEIYEQGRLTGAPDTWASGILHTKAGIAMLAAPRTGTPAYDQGDAPSVGFRDCAKVSRTGLHRRVLIGSFDHVLETDEWAPMDPTGGHQLKLYAPGVGLIQAAPAGNGTGRETLSLIGFTRLSPRDLAKMHRAVLAMDARGRLQVSRDVWGRTGAAT